jgi:transcription initiation factor IIE alpha subunit
MNVITEQVERLRELSKQDKLGLIPWNGYSEILNQAADTIEQLAAKVRPITGHWINHYDEEAKEGWYECDCCHTERAFNTDFCPDCGARMFEPQETETWNGIHAQITAPKGTFERIFNDADDENDI